MRNRLLAVLAVLALMTTIAFAVPLGASVAKARTQELVLARTADLSRFATLAYDYATDGDLSDLQMELETYDLLYGEKLIVQSSNGFAQLNTGIDDSRDDVRIALAAAERNQKAPAPKMLTPFSAPTLLLAQPIGADSQVAGAVLVELSTVEARRDILRGWLAVVAGSLLALLVFGAIALMLSRWILRPLANLNRRLEHMRDELPFVTPKKALPGKAESFEGPRELKIINRTLDTMKSSLGSSITAQRRLVADTAHQLRNPLAALQLRLDILGSIAGESMEGSLIEAQLESDRLAGLLDDLLRLARAEALAQNTACLEREDLVPLISRRVDFWKPTAASTEASLKATFKAPSVFEQIHTSAVEQILDVLLDNALKYAQGAQVSVELSPNPAGTELTVTDTGPGVSAEHLPRIVERFYRDAEVSDRSSNSEGSGLGLPIAVALAESMGAALEFRSPDHGGLSVTLKFPRHHNSAREI